MKKFAFILTSRLSSLRSTLLTMLQTSQLISLLIPLLFGAPAAAKQHFTVGDSGRHSEMVFIRGGSYTPFFQAGAKITESKVKCFYMDRHAVTNKEYLVFVKANPRWARSKVPHLLADHTYLQDWSGDFTIGKTALLERPVTNVSWFAAAAYAKWAGKRLPTMDEWEYVMASPPKQPLPKGESLTAYILNWYSKPTQKILPTVMSTYKNKLGVYDMVGLIWEWVYDFNGIIKGSDSRSEAPLQATLFCANSTQIALNKQDYASFMRFAFRASLKANYCIRNLGFRCVKDAP